MSIKGYGVIVQGIASLRQCLELIIRTTQGTDPLRPEFGTKIYSFQDAPLNIAIPNIKREIFEAVEIWEQRVKLISISHTVPKPGNPVFEILYKVTDEEIIDRLTLDLQAGVLSSNALNEIILQAFYPANPNNHRFQISLERNGSQVFPLPNPDGFETINDLFAWVKANWFFLGKFYQLTDKFLCYMNADGITSATMAITVFPIVRFDADFPQLAPGHFYDIVFKENGVPVAAIPQTFNTPGQVLNYMQENFPGYDWLIQYNVNGDTIFSDEFSDEFSVPSTGYKLVGVSHVEGFVGELIINSI